MKWLVMPTAYGEDQNDGCRKHALVPSRLHIHNLLRRMRNGRSDTRTISRCPRSNPTFDTAIFFHPGSPTRMLQPISILSCVQTEKLPALLLWLANNAAVMQYIRARKAQSCQLQSLSRTNSSYTYRKELWGDHVESCVSGGNPSVNHGSAVRSCGRKELGKSLPC
jgi:hypothetical protein